MPTASNAELIEALPHLEAPSGMLDMPTPVEAVVENSPAIPMKTQLPKPSEMTVVPAFTGFDLIDGGKAVVVSAVDDSATDPATMTMANISEQLFDPSTVLGSGVEPSTTSTFKTVSNRKSVSEMTESADTATVIEATPIQIEPAKNDGTVQLAGEIKL